MRIARLVCCGAAMLLLVGAGRPLPLHGQNPPAAPKPGSQTPVFRATTALVEVDAVVLDRDGKFVPGLVAEDLELYEDGKPQQIQNFYLVTHDAAQRAAGAPGELTPERARRVFVFLFDEEHLSNDSLLRVKRGAEEFIQTQMGPGDFGGVVAAGRMHRGRLSSDKNELIAGVRSVRPAFDNRQALMRTFTEFPRIPSELDASRIHDGARELVVEIGITACREDPFQCESAGGLNQVENMVERKARNYTRVARVMTTNTIQNIRYVTNGLSRIPGRKTIVLLSEGFFVAESRTILQTVAGQAARAGTAIYSIDGRGQVHGTGPMPDASDPNMARSTSFDTNEDGPAILTANTGGFRLANIDDIGRALNIVARDTSTYYVLGYQPTNKTMDGKYRKIEVRPTADGLKVRARKGYIAMPLPTLELARGGK